MFNSSSLGVETPQKQCLSRDNKTPVKVKKVVDRFKPSYSVRLTLKKLIRVHQFQYHQQVEFIKLEELDMKRDIAIKIREYVKDADISDLVLQFEDVACQTKVYDSEIREYISEEFDIEKELSFSVLAIFNYMKRFQLGVETALEELFSLSTVNSVCEECVTGPETKEEREKSAEFYNFSSLRSSKSNSQDESFPLYASDDSDKDPDYDIIKEPEFAINSSESDSSRESGIISVPNKDQTRTTVFNPFLSPEKDVFEFNNVNKSATVFNPFVASDESDSEADADRFMPPLNSTPKEQDDAVDNFLRSSSIQNRKSSRVDCQFCHKNFGNRYNMKLHLIRHYNA